MVNREFHNIVEAYNDNFSKFNTLYFGNKLPQVEFYVPTIRASEALGECLSLPLVKEHKFYDYVITLTDKYRAPISIYEDVLIHEMIHLENQVLFPEQLYDGDNPLSNEYGHDTSCFKNEMNRLNERFGRHIEIKTDITDRSIFKLTDKYKKQYMDEMKNIFYYCVHYDGKEVYVYLVDDEKQKELVDEINNKFQNSMIEKVKMNNCHYRKSEFSDSVKRAMIFDEGDDFNEFKKTVSEVILESEEKKPKNDYKDDMVFFRGRWYMCYT